jgi:hypothetical protein
MASISVWMIWGALLMAWSGKTIVFEWRPEVVCVVLPAEDFVAVDLGTMFDFFKSAEELSCSIIPVQQRRM